MQSEGCISRRRPRPLRRQRGPPARRSSEAASRARCACRRENPSETPRRRARPSASGGRARGVSAAAGIRARGTARGGNRAFSGRRVWRVGGSAPGGNRGTGRRPPSRCADRRAPREGARRRPAGPPFAPWKTYRRRVRVSGFTVSHRAKRGLYFPSKEPLTSYPFRSVRLSGMRVYLELQPFLT